MVTKALRLYSSHGAGYLRVKINGKFILYHRYLMEKHLGRKLQPHEVIHHKGLVNKVRQAPVV